MPDAPDENLSEEPLEEAAAPPAADGPIARDLPCVRCGYNLRGLRDDVNCPECGCPVERTLEMLEGSVLCPSCMASNQPSMALCRVCGSPLQGAGALANYFRGPVGAATIATRRRLTSVVLLWIFLGPMCLGSIAVVASFLLDLFDTNKSNGPERFFITAISAVAGLVSGCILFAVTRAYIKRPEETEPEEDDDADD